MRKIYTLLTTLLSSGLLYAGNITWTGAVSSDWTNPLNWSAGVPLTTDDLVFSNPAAPFMPTLDMARVANSITFSGGSLDLNTFTLTLNGNSKSNVLSSGMISNGILDFSNNTSVLTFSGTTFLATINANVGRVNFNGSTFNSPVVVKKNSTNVDNSVGGNTFNSTFDFTSALGAGDINLATTSPDTYLGVVSITNQAASTITFSRGTNSTFASTVEVNSTSTGTIGFGLATGLGPIFNAGLIEGATMVNSGSVRLDKATINVAWNTTFNSAGTGVLRIASSTVNADLTYDGPGFTAGFSTFTNPVVIRRRGGAVDNGSGGNTFNNITLENYGSTPWTFNNATPGNTFNGTFDVIQNGTAEVRLINNSTSPTTFNSTATFTNNSGGILTVALNGNNQVDFNSTLTWINNSTGTIRGAISALSVLNINNTFNISNFSTGIVTTATTGTVNLAGVLNFVTFQQGTMNLTKVNQTVANPITANFTNNAILSVLNSNFIGTFTAVVPAFRSQNSIYNDVADFTQNGSIAGDSYGSNTFMENVTFSNIGTSRLQTATTIGDNFLKDVTVNYTSGTTRFAYRGINNIGGNLILNSATNPVIAEVNGTISFNGSGNQSLQLIGATQVTADNIALGSKSGGQVNLQTELRVLTNIAFGDYTLNLNGNDLLITNLLGSAVTFNNGGILCEDPTQTSAVIWTINANTDNHIIPFRNSAGELVGVEIQGIGASLGNFTATTYGTNNANTPFPPAVNALQNNSGSNNSHKVMDRFFHISKSAGGSATVAFNYGDSEMTGVNAISEANLQAQRWNGTKWETPVGTVDQGLNKVTIAGLSTFSNWTLVDNSSPLPVEMQSFSAAPKGKTVLVSWLTGVEKNNDRFEIEKSTDAINYTMIGSVKGVNQDNSRYSFTDQLPSLGTNYYKLKQVDFDGYYTYSEVRMVNFTDDGFVSIYPSQTSDMIYINFNGKKGETTIEISDISGRKVYSESFNCENQQIKSLSCKNWGLGLYIVKIKSGQTDIISKIVVQ